jgi:LysM repeat protein
MATMTRVAGTVLGLVLVSLAGGACGGGGEEFSGLGERITDPGSVESSTPIQNPVVYKYDGDVVTTEGGEGPISGGSTPIAEDQTYTVKAGDTCSGIATQFGITLDALLRANRQIDAECRTLREGDVLRIPATTTSGSPGQPTATPRPGQQRTYTVQAGDTCAGIAQSFSVDVNELIALNGIDPDCRDLHEGQVVRIP